MPKADIPHFDLPFAFGYKFHANVVEQDSIDDLANCVQAIVRTEVGERAESPEFGIDSPVFDNRLLELDGMREAILVQEPRAATLIDQKGDEKGLDEFIAELVIQVSQISEVTNVE